MDDLIGLLQLGLFALLLWGAYLSITFREGRKSERPNDSPQLPAQDSKPVVTADAIREDTRLA
jgi:hypothetical protein